MNAGNAGTVGNGGYHGHLSDGRWLTLAIAWFTAIACLWLYAEEPLGAQGGADAPNDTALEGWLLAGVDATVGTRGRVTASGGYVGGFDTWLVVVEESFASSAALQLVAGQLYLRPTARGTASTSVLRAGASWLPLRGRFALDNRLLVERRSTRKDVSARVRSRLRLSWVIAEEANVRLFTAIEAFAIDRRDLSERRYQAGVAAPIGRAFIEVYWMRSAARRRSPFDAVGVTVLWRGAIKGCRACTHGDRTAGSPR